MKKFVTKTAVIACLLGPVLANAENDSKTYTGSSPSDSHSFTLGALSNVSIDYTWSDMLLSQEHQVIFENNASSLGWTLTGGSSPQSGSFTDVTGQRTGAGTLSFSNLSAGRYTLTLAGTWGSVTKSGEDWNKTSAKVNLLDGDKPGEHGHELNSFSKTAVTALTPVPEPESYAMLLAGLGLMGTIARRRNQDKAA